MARNVPIQIRVSEEEKKMFEKASEKGGYSGISDFLRVTAIEKSLEILK